MKSYGNLILINLFTLCLKMFGVGDWKHEKMQVVITVLLMKGKGKIYAHCSIFGSFSSGFGVSAPSKGL